jgi:hypothetical protein
LWGRPIAGGQHDLTSQGPPTPEVDMPLKLVLADSIVGRADALPPAFHCS